MNWKAFWIAIKASISSRYNSVLYADGDDSI